MTTQCVSVVNGYPLAWRCFLSIRYRRSLFDCLFLHKTVYLVSLKTRTVFTIKNRLMRDDIELQSSRHNKIPHISVLLTVCGHVGSPWKRHIVGGDRHHPSNQNPHQENKRAYLKAGYDFIWAEPILLYSVLLISLIQYTVRKYVPFNNNNRTVFVDYYKIVWLLIKSLMKEKNTTTNRVKLNHNTV